jgi:hypothetical protein
MAQTVATQRGTTSVPINSRTTLFTQSGGNSTRVILNQVTWYTQYVVSSLKAQLLHVSSSGPISIIGYFYYAGSYISSLSPQMMPNPNGTGPIQGGGYSGGGSVNGIIYGGGGTAGWIGAKNADYIIVVMSGNVYSYMPQNYWIGPGDSIAFNIYTDNSESPTVGYHFTTITES